ncbi:MAG: hypothetical protein M0Z30_23430 [Actinomycetota bacterium]|nr:hypothetical protein [Actinomycetota bacterium]
MSQPSFLTESAVLCWVGQARANNTVRNRLSRVCTFLRWCVRAGEADPALVEALSGRDNPLRQIPRLYGKVHAPRLARWLSHEEAFYRLVGACRDGTDLGLRDEVLIRLGLAGIPLKSSRSVGVQVRLALFSPPRENLGKQRLAPGSLRVVQARRSHQAQ